MSDVTDTVIETIKKENPLLKRKNKFPGETFRLPSRGLLYTNGEIDEEVKDGEVIVSAMTTLDEIYMRTPDMLFQGTAVEIVFKRCIPQIKKPLELFANDVDFLLTCLRKVSYGDTFLIQHTCDKCPRDKAKELEYQIPLTYFIQNSREFSQTDLNELKMVLTSGETIILRPSSFAEMMRIMQVNEMEIKTPEEMNTLLIGALCSAIREVDGITDKKFIEEWLTELPTKIVSEFATKLEKLNKWGPNFEYTIQCKDCGSPQKITSVVNPLYFFIIPSSRKTA